MYVRLRAVQIQYSSTELCSYSVFLTVDIMKGEGMEAKKRREGRQFASDLIIKLWCVNAETHIKGEGHQPMSIGV